ncbi:ImmA/IrrE family metallo-endopeptidase [Paenibacillus sonchi]|uniref:ImmA/IrrE family metallo-endopeptidase n=3 Tax=Paenibacillus sonchi TaxID=373687 RepID=A0A974PHT6_9BACL|nr:ImmA/IrrE family metallo-endopeptidase [Paenibacillus sonchi]
MGDSMIKHAVTQLVKKYRTNDPFDIASQKNILVFFELLGEMFGYYNYNRRFQMIHINSEAKIEEQRFTCAHELGHAILHSNVNTPFLRKHTLYSVDRIEKEANRFAVELLVPDELLLKGATIQEVAALCGIPEEVAKLKELSNRSFWQNEDSFFHP